MMEQVDDGLTEHITKHMTAYMPGVLVPKVHHRLVDNLDGFARAARIHPNFITNSATSWCPPHVMQWLTDYPELAQKGITGLCLVGDEAHAMDQCMALAGCMLRNFKDARIVYLNEILEKRATNCAMAFCPDFYIGRAGADKGSVKTDLAKWDVPLVRDWVQQRFSQQKSTVIYVNDLEGLRRDYGESIFGLMDKHYKILGG